jgi:hypothetical protein
MRFVAITEEMIRKTPEIGCSYPPGTAAPRQSSAAESHDRRKLLVERFLLREPASSDGPATGSVASQGSSLRRVAARPGNSRAMISVVLLVDLHQPQVRLEALALDEQPCGHRCLPGSRICRSAATVPCRQSPA